jgi:hypothetical protein
VVTKDVYAMYRESKFSKKFYAEHGTEIEKCKAAKAYFDEQKLDKLPTIKMLQQEFAVLSAEVNKCYSEYHPARKQMQDILTAKQNCEMILDYRSTERAAENTRAEQ